MIFSSPIKLAIVSAMTLVILLGLVGSLDACPNCKGSVAESGTDGMAAGFAWSIGWLLLVPIGIVTAWCVALRRVLRSCCR